MQWTIECWSVKRLLSLLQALDGLAFAISSSENPFLCAGQWSSCRWAACSILCRGREAVRQVLSLLSWVWEHAIGYVLTGMLWSACCFLQKAPHIFPSTANFVQFTHLLPALLKRCHFDNLHEAWNPDALLHPILARPLHWLFSFCLSPANSCLDVNLPLELISAVAAWNHIKQQTCAWSTLNLQMLWHWETASHT